MLFALLFLYLFGGSGVDGMVKDIAKPVKEYVQDKAKAKQIIAINEEMLGEEAALRKDTGKAKKQVAKINGNRLASEAEFAEVFAVLDQKRAEAREKILENRFKMKELMTAGEWSRVYATADQQD